MRRIAVFSLLVSAAIAQGAAECPIPEVVQVLPEPGSKDVPINARVLVELAGEARCLPTEPELRLMRGGNEVRTTLRAWDTAGGRTFELRPESFLPGHVEHTVEAIALDGVAGHGEVFRFETGARPLAPDDAPPRLRIQEALYESALAGEETRYSIRFEVAPTRDVHPFDLLHVAIESEELGDDEGGYAITMRPDAEGWSTETGFTADGRAAEKICVVARHQDVAGHWSELARACADAEPVEGLFEDGSKGDGCRAAPGAPGAAWLLLVLLGLRRRATRPA